MNKPLLTYSHHPWIISGYLLASSALLIGGLALPTLTFKELVFFKHTFSILTGIESLYKANHIFLAVILFLFSVIFPIAKLCLLSYIWFIPMKDLVKLKILHWLSLTGKWSMLDVFVVAIIIVTTQFSKSLSAQPREGIYLFCLSVLLAMHTTSCMQALLHKKNP